VAIYLSIPQSAFKRWRGFRKGCSVSAKDGLCSFFDLLPDGPFCSILVVVTVYLIVPCDFFYALLEQFHCTTKHPEKEISDSIPVLWQFRSDIVKAKAKVEYIKQGKSKGKALSNSTSSPPKPPDDNEKPEDNDEKHNVPQPPTSLSRSHIIHTTECTCEDSACFWECVVLVDMNQVGQGVSKKLERVRRRTIWLNWTVDSLTSFPIPIVI